MSGPELRVARLNLGMTQEELSRALDVPVNTIARWERSELAIQHAQILRLALSFLAQKKTASHKGPAAR